jgi:hypothetical protein
MLCVTKRKPARLTDAGCAAAAQVGPATAVDSSSTVQHQSADVLRGGFKNSVSVRDVGCLRLRAVNYSASSNRCCQLLSGAESGWFTSEPSLAAGVQAAGQQRQGVHILQLEV